MFFLTVLLTLLYSLPVVNMDIIDNVIGVIIVGVIYDRPAHLPLLLPLCLHFHVGCF